MVLVSGCWAQRDLNNTVSLPLREHHQHKEWIPRECRHQEPAKGREAVLEGKKKTWVSASGWVCGWFGGCCCIYSLYIYHLYVCAASVYTKLADRWAMGGQLHGNLCFCLHTGYKIPSFTEILTHALHTADVHWIFSHNIASELMTIQWRMMDWSSQCYTLTGLLK